MFLQSIITKNPRLVEASVSLHQQNKIPAGSYVLDLDTIRANAAKIVQEARACGLKVFAMTKQVSRNPAMLRVLQEEGIDGCVCVDMDDARAVFASGLRIGHLGHLVQVPKAEVAAAVSMKPMFWTVYSLDKAKEISDALPEGQTQEILLRIYEKGNIFYPGHEGGFPVEELDSVIEQIEAMPGLRFAGFSTFPTQLFNHMTNQVEHTGNYETLLKTARKYEEKLGRKLEINAPGTTSSHLFKEMAASGVTQVEPGHGFTGTCPQHARQELPENPAVAYVSEISHRYQGKDYCYGGGMYIDPVLEAYDVKACVGKTGEEALSQMISCQMPKPESIDYYGILQTPPEAQVRTGDTAVFGFRIQGFVTRAFVVPVEGIQSGAPVVRGIYNAEGREAGWPLW